MQSINLNKVIQVKNNRNQAACKNLSLTYNARGEQKRADKSENLYFQLRAWGSEFWLGAAANPEKSMGEYVGHKCKARVAAW
jgi:hypothetical protein